MILDGILAQSLTRDTKKILGDCKDEYFVSRHNKQVLQACKDLVAAGSAPTVQGLLTTFDWGDAARDAIQTMNLTGGAYCDLPLALDALKRDWLGRGIKALAQTVVDADDPASLGAGLISNISNLIVQADGGKLEVKTLRESMEHLQEGMPLLSAAQAANKVVTRIQGIDDTVRMGAGRLGIVAAMASAGKTSIVIQIAQQTARRGGRGVMVSLEMEEAEINSRRLSNWTGRGSWKILTNQKKMTFDRGHLEAADNCLNITCGAGQDWFSLDAKLRSMHAAKKLDYIIVDYFTLLEAPEKRKGENSAQSYGHISKGAKMLAKDLQCCVILVSQFNRTADENQEPQLKQLKETSQLEQDADFALLFWNSNMPAATPGDRIVNCRVAKNRGGKRGDLFHLVFSPDTCRFVQATTDQRGLAA